MTIRTGIMTSLICFIFLLHGSLGAGAEITADFQHQLKNQLSATVLSLLFEGMKKDGLLKKSAAPGEVEKTGEAGKVLACVRQGQFQAYVSGADGKPYIRFILKGAYVGRRIRIPDGANFPYNGPFPSDQMEFFLTSIAEELIKKETRVSIMNTESLKNQAAFQVAITRGLDAAGRQDFISAIGYFNQAKEADPYSPQVLFNLALAYDKAGGREVSAIPWYLAYLASSPKAANIPVVRKRISELEAGVETNAKTLLEYAERARQVLRESPGGFNRAVDLCLAFARIRLGENNKARLGLEKFSDQERQYLLEELALQGARRGDMSEAQKLAGPTPEKILLAQLRYQSGEKKFSEARKTASRIGPEGYYELSRHLALTGHIQSAKETAGLITRELAVQYGLPAKANLGDQAYFEIVKIQAAGHDFSGARETASWIKSGTIKLKADHYRREMETKKRDRVLAEEEIIFWANLEDHYDHLSGCGDALSGTSDLIGRTVIKDLNNSFRPSKEEKDPANTVHYLSVGASSLIKFLELVRDYEWYWRLRRNGQP